MSPEGLVPVHEAAEHFSNIVLYRFPGGAEARVRGTRLAVWRLAAAIEELGGSDAVARHYEIPSALVEEAVEYAGAHPEQISSEAAASRAVSIERLCAELPGLRVFDVPADRT